MGAFSSDTPRLLWLCTIVACFVLIVNSYQVSADSKLDADLVFDTLDQTNLKKHENHPRIEREVSLVDEETNVSPPVEEEHWLSSTVNRIRRSISSYFNKNEDRGLNTKIHHNKVSEHKLANKIVGKPKSQSTRKRKHRQINGQINAQEDYDDDDDIEEEQEEDDAFENEDEDVYANEYNNRSSIDDGGIQQGTWTDDEDDLEINSGAGSSGEVPDVKHETSTPSIIDYGHPRVYRFTFTVLEPYVGDFNDRNSNAFQNLANRIKRAIESLYQSVPGDQYATVISIQESESDQFKVIVTVDVDSDRNYDQERIKNIIYSQIENNHRIGNFTVTPENFFFREFGASQSKCESYELPCQSGQCVPLDARCNGVRDCNDNTDEEGCEREIPVEPEIPIEPEHPNIYLTPPSASQTTPSSPTEYPLEGSGDECRADDSVRCADNSRTICADQVCDGVADCADGGDERNCRPHECAIGEFKCDVSRCIPVKQRCDGTPDCSDGTDEHNCVPNCSEDELLCDNKCISKEQRCDRIQDCQDGTDEANCAEPQPQCRSGELPCGDGQCIPDYLRCDGTQHCRNGYDELNCTARCRAEEFTCDSGKCIPYSAKCNRKYDCEDLSDERNCPCLSTDFHCANGFCIPDFQRCDGVHNCQDMSDEIGCTSMHFGFFVNCEVALALTLE